MKIGILGFGVLGKALKKRLEKTIKNTSITIFSEQKHSSNEFVFKNYSEVSNFSGPVLVSASGENVTSALKNLVNKKDVYVFTKALIKDRFIMDNYVKSNFKYVRGLLFAKDIISNKSLNCCVYTKSNVINKDLFLSSIKFCLEHTDNIRISELISIYKNPLAIYFAQNNVKDEQIMRLALEKICLAKEKSLPKKIAKCIIDDFKICSTSKQSRNYEYGLNLRTGKTNNYVPEGVKYYRETCEAIKKI
tara:strand:- start:1562 stop:2305 length:744 start_codon:yes stop_codon:yes gene_type:complete